MMKGLSHFYVESLRIGLNPYFANWLPNEPLAVGDYGYLKGCMFNRKNNLIHELGKPIQSIHKMSKFNIFYFSSKGVSFNPFAKGSVDTLASGSIPVKAHLDISFSKKGGVYFNAANCKITEVKDIESLGKTILKRFECEEWDHKLVVVTSIVKADSTTALVSSSNKASIVLEADASVSEIDLADASIKLKIRSCKDIGLSYVTEAGCVPIFTLAKIKLKFFGDNYFIPRFIADGIKEDYLKIKREHVNAGKDIADFFAFEELADI